MFESSPLQDRHESFESPVTLMNGAHDHYKQPAIWEINSFSSSSTQGKKDGAQTLKQWTPAWKTLQCYLETWLLSSLLPLRISKTFPCCSGVTIGDMSAIHQLRQQTCGRRRVSQDAWFPMQRKSQSALPIWSASFRVERPEKKDAVIRGACKTSKCF